MEPTGLTVVLCTAGNNKLRLLQTMMTITGKGLKDAKDLIDNVPSIIMQGVSVEEALRIQAQIEQTGAEVELQK